MYREPRKWSLKHKFAKNMENIEDRNKMIEYVNSFDVPPERPNNIDNVDGWISTSRYNMNVIFLKNFEEDNYRERRISRQECKTCFNSTYLALQAFTDTSCGICNCTISHHNSNVPMVCVPCSLDKNICVHCGGDMD